MRRVADRGLGHALAAFAELEKSPDYLHTYRVTAVSVWNAAALGLDAKSWQAHRGRARALAGLGRRADALGAAVRARLLAPPGATARARSATA